jgi:hypothetical protein
MEPEVPVVGGTGVGGIVFAGGTDVEGGGTLLVVRVVVAVVDGGVVIAGGGVRSGVTVGGGNVGAGAVVVVAEVREGENGDSDVSVVSGAAVGCVFCITNQPPKLSITNAAMT